MAYPKSTIRARVSFYRLAAPLSATASVAALLCAAAQVTMPAVASAMPAVASATPAVASATPDGRIAATGTAAASAPAPAHALYRSRELWATIDVCSPPDQQNTVGVRGSMPGDGQARDTMYMSFRLQYEDSATRRWVDLASGAPPAYVSVGTGKSARQAGRSFQLVPVAGKPAFTLRGVVSFQWRRGVKVVHAVSRPTTAGQLSLAGADPAGFSAATCVIG